MSSKDTLGNSCGLGWVEDVHPKTNNQAQKSSPFRCQKNLLILRSLEVPIQALKIQML